MRNSTEKTVNAYAARLIAFYLPQFHPIPENDEWWGRGFTEWTNVAKAKPLFRGHYQPHVPADLGFYDLRVAETRAAQAEMARAHGIEAFCYYHYWFGGKRILERPFNEVLRSGQPDFPFCFCWANQTWTGIWHGSPERILIEQTYPGYGDHKLHFDVLLEAFTDERYLKIDGKPIFLIYRPKELPESKNVIAFWKEMALKAGLKGLYVIGVSEQPEWNPNEYGFDASMVQRLPSRKKWVSKRHPIKWFMNKYHQITHKPAIYSYKDELPETITPSDSGIIKYPCIIPNWDNTPRCGEEGLVLHESTPEFFRTKLRELLRETKKIPCEHNLIFIKAWNEWAEGNHLEPDHRFGMQYLRVVREEVSRNGQILPGR